MTKIRDINENFYWVLGIPTSIAVIVTVWPELILTICGLFIFTMPVILLPLFLIKEERSWASLFRFLVAIGCVAVLILTQMGKDLNYFN